MTTTAVNEDMLQQVKQQLLQPANEYSKVDALERLHTVLSSRGQREAALGTMNTITLPLLFAQLDTTSEIQLESAVKVLQKVLSLLPLDVINQILSDSSVINLLKIGSLHGYESVRALGLEQLAKLDVRTLFSNSDFVQIVGQAFLDRQYLSISKQSSEIICSWVKQPTLEDTSHALKLMFDPSSQFLTILKGAMNNNNNDDVLQLRVFELLADVGTLNESAFNAIVSTGLLDEFVNDFGAMYEKGNVLSLLNLLEIVKKWCSSRSAIEWLHNRGLFTTIVKILVDNRDDELIASFIFHLIADVSATGHQILSDDFLSSDSQIVFTRLNESMQSSDLAKQTSALVIIGNLCSQSSVALKRFLIDNEERRDYFLSFMVDARSQDVQVTFLNTLAQIGQRIELEHLSKHLFDRLEQHILPNRTSKHHHNYLMNQLFDILKSDIFPDVRHAVFHVLRSLAYHTWGIDQYLLPYPTFIQFLVNRTTEITKEAKDWKYGIAEVMWKTLKNNKGACGGQLSSPDYVKLRVYLQRGPYLEDTEAAVIVQTKSA